MVHSEEKLKRIEWRNDCKPVHWVKGTNKGWLKTLSDSKTPSPLLDQRADGRCCCWQSSKSCPPADTWVLGGRTQPLPKADQQWGSEVTSPVTCQWLKATSSPRRCTMHGGHLLRADSKTEKAKIQQRKSFTIFIFSWFHIHISNHQRNTGSAEDWLA